MSFSFIYGTIRTHEFRRTAAPLLRDRSSSQRTAGGLHRTQSREAGEARSLTAASLHGLLRMGTRCSPGRTCWRLRFNDDPSTVLLYQSFKFKTCNRLHGKTCE